MIPSLNTSANAANLCQVFPIVDMEIMRRSFDLIQPDPYNKDGFRYRAASRFSCRNRTIIHLENVPLFQDNKYNPIEGYGGIARNYPDLPEWFIQHDDFIALVNHWLDLVPEELETFSIHQIRTVTPGLPVPEGKHRDGNDWVGIFVADRHNISENTGVTKVWNEEGEVIFQEILQAGSLTSFDDRVTYHDTSQVEALPGKEGYRDVFVFSSPDHKHYLK